MAKSILYSGPVVWALSGLIGGYMGLIKHATRWQVRGRAHVEPVWAAREGMIMCGWHGRNLFLKSVWPADAGPIAILISRSREGDVVARAAGLNGVALIRGSSRNEKKKDKDKGGAAAFREMVRFVRARGCMTITPDGPRGPRQRCTPGAVKLAQITGAALVPVSWSTRWGFRLKSWDRFHVPLPFSQGVIVWGEPVRLPDNPGAEDLEAARLLVEERLNAITLEADLACGKEPVLPASAS
ncbi:lysophospholipid acyltransferase family protein [Alkalicaulis satelles]|uniref:Lysophospholipid acyltransferase family protein n=1 Tax=Alkalicaulis satelles TaxID=2609175 RepID=A0A5M6ZML7_9PROT|nr:lysophospholipid acyltransferase family protein [Alkalicaulis satelles]KAA5803531.1 lysophospholipid acyltransferase family protein [Alkalicaulis satelles]